MYNDRPQGPQNNQGYDPSGHYNNPAANIPGPWPANANTAWWIGDRMPLTWAATTGATVAGASFFNTTWGTPLFDLRPELRNSGQNRSDGVPIWRAGYGAGARLWVQIDGLNQATATTSAVNVLRVQTQEFGHIFDSSRVRSITPQVDISRDFIHNGDRNSIVLCFFPPSDGYPIRYWRMTLTFTKTANQDPRGANVALTICGAYY